MKAVVTGGAGFLGSHLCDRLLQMEYEVVCLDNLLTGSLDNIAHLKRHPTIHIRQSQCRRIYFCGGPASMRFFTLRRPPHRSITWKCQSRH